ncbi:DUF5689 domain-containing protein [Psychroserpens sp. SPM9]|uniref:DUF5689 domain-containing protein n=1 Tax=Psychroserpens sp. SPM9 TaxID=2975598 RepID=UPI0021A3448E|nr:DUF5689 domain-containing protein [Psychroserpens sp. SPM9]MDG5490908.1 DUF5689 domain-containing protein [Psychroserpens sp. SPM9]
MKTINLNKIILLALSLVVFNACVQDDDFDTPNVEVTDPVITGNIIDIDAVLGNLAQSDDDIVTFEGTNNFMEGYVISSDEGGNFFEEIVLQDKPENPTAGIVVQVDVNPLFTIYDFGRKVYVKLDGLSVAVDNGVVQLGRRDGNELAKIAGSEMSEYILRTSEVATIVPLEVNISDFSEDLESLYIRLSDVQFNRNDVLGDNPKTFAAEDNDDFDGERQLESCAEGSSVILSTSTFSDFKSLLLPANRGTLDGILTRDFFDEFYTIYINSPEDINFDNAERCDPDFLECTTPSGGGANIFDEDFEGFGTFASEGWDNINISGTDTDWFTESFSGNNYARISAFSSGNAEANVWLVTPAIDFDTTTGEELSFDIQSNFDNGTILSVWISTDYAGDPETATWQALDASIPVGPSGGFGSFEPVGPINVSCIDGTVNIGFFYEGSDPNATTRYHLDNVEVSGN